MRATTLEADARADREAAMSTMVVSTRLRTCFFFFCVFVMKKQNQFREWNPRALETGSNTSVEICIYVKR